MPNEVVISARVQLDDVMRALQQIQSKGKQTQDALAQASQDSGKKISQNAKLTQTNMEALRSYSRRIAEEIRGAFESMVQIKSLDALGKFGSKIKESVGGAVALGDSIRKLSIALGIAESDMVSFQTKLLDGFSKVGLGADEARNAIEGLAGTGVNSQDALVKYAVTSGQLAQISGEQGQEGAIAKGLAEAMRAAGKDVNNQADLDRFIKATQGAMSSGQTATQATSGLADMYGGMSTDDRKVSPQAYSDIAALTAALGPEVGKTLQEYMSKSKLDQLPQNAQGMGKFFTKEGIDVKGLSEYFGRAGGRVGFSQEAGLQTLGIGNVAGANLLAQNGDKAAAAVARSRGFGLSVDQQQQQTMGLGDAAKGVYNKGTKFLNKPLSEATGFATDLVKSVASSESSSQAALLGGGLLAFAGAAGSLSKVLKGKGMGKAAGGITSALAKGAAAELVTGQKTVPVYVVNADEIGGISSGMVASSFTDVASGNGTLNKAGKAAGMLGGGALAGMAGYELGKAIEPFVTSALDRAFTTTWKTRDGAEMKGNPIERMFSEAYDLLASISGKLSSIGITGKELNEKIQQSQKIRTKNDANSVGYRGTRG